MSLHFLRYSILLILFSYARGQSCPTAPVVYHSTLDEICSKEPARSAIGCGMNRICNSKTNVYPAACSTWKIASSLCNDDTSIVVSYSSFCAQLQSSYSSAAQFQSCMQPYTFKNTLTVKANHLEACGWMEGMPMGGCDTCTRVACPDPLYAYSQGCIDMDMGQCSDWLKFCRYGDGAPNGQGAVVLCLGNRTSTVAPPWPPSPPPNPVKASPSPPLQPPPPQPPSPRPPPPPIVLPLCVTNSSLPECVWYEYPAASIAADLVSLCMDMPYMPGCTVMFACQAGDITGDFCQPFTLLSSICADMPSMRGCKAYRTLCANTSVVDQCKLYPAIPGLPTTKLSATAIATLCSGSMASTMTICGTCSQISCPDYLGGIVGLCSGMPSMKGCGIYTSWCNASAAWQQAGNGNLGSYCPALNSPPPSPSPPLPPPSPPPPAHLCVTNSSLPRCASYEYPAVSIAADLISLCNDMPYMPGCTVMSACQSGTVTGDFCRPFTLLSSICYDMPGMSGCKSYRTLCAANSVVPQCTQFPAIPGLPTTKQAKAAVTSICANVSGPECSTCSTISCSDYLALISGACPRAPSATGCELFTSWCNASAAWEQPASSNSSSSISVYCKGSLPYLTSPPPPPSPPSPTPLPPPLRVSSSPPPKSTKPPPKSPSPPPPKPKSPPPPKPKSPPPPKPKSPPPPKPKSPPPPKPTSPPPPKPKSPPPPKTNRPPPQP
ncbi:hypothetical protein Agub_g7059 [Astrephomene gubernaculifera]|uniref:Uncharacterized protein n=1 Tax=Astrephomene gubernaculifera TaxID=47775 RepID=A0AAD3HLF1_9CHLO|nr:hypothetical protein Agub_g7059 [Astrephomene gubernaculifera]